MTRKFSAKLEPFRLGDDGRRQIAEALQTPDLPETVLVEIEERLRDAVIATALGMDSRHSTTEAGARELRRLEALASDLADGLRNISDESQGFLDNHAPYGCTESVAMLAIQIDLACAEHDSHTKSEKIGRTDGPTMKSVALHLALGIAPFWERYSGRRWSHNGAWGHFVGVCFKLAGVDANAHGMAQLAAKEWPAYKEYKEKRTRQRSDLDAL